MLYSATKYLGGHSDLVAGVALGSPELVDRVKMYRTILGTMLEPYSAWLLMRSLETAKLRITCAREERRAGGGMVGEATTGRVGALPGPVAG